MPTHTIMSYNIEHMNNMFSNGRVKQSEEARARRIAEVITRRDPDLLGICEGANAREEHEDFIARFLPNSGYQVALGTSRGGQNLLYYHRDPFRLVSIDESGNSYNNFVADLENDGLKEQHRFERKPLEAVFEIGAGGPRVQAILVHTKSKGIFDVVGFHRFEEISLANRKRLAGQAFKLRARLDALLEQPQPAVVVMGDFNDGPGFDPFERMLGKSFVEETMGSVYAPHKIFHNTLAYMRGDSDLFTVSFPDPIVANRFRHRIWIDHILVSPDMLLAGSPVRHAAESGGIDPNDAVGQDASDHRAVFCRIET